MKNSTINAVLLQARNLKDLNIITEEELTEIGKRLSESAEPSITEASPVGSLPELLTCQQAMEYLQVTYLTLRRYIEQGKLVRIKVNSRKSFITKASVMKYLSLQ